VRHASEEFRVHPRQPRSLAKAFRFSFDIGFFRATRLWPLDCALTFLVLSTFTISCLIPAPVFGDWRDSIAAQHSQTCEHPDDPDYAAGSALCVKKMSNVFLTSFEAFYRPTTDGRKEYACRAAMDRSDEGFPLVSFVIEPYSFDGGAVNLCSLLQWAFISNKAITIEAVVMDWRHWRLLKATLGLPLN
jgi:hypothetical protein